MGLLHLLFLMRKLADSFVPLDGEILMILPTGPQFGHICNISIRFEDGCRNIGVLCL